MAKEIFKDLEFDGKAIKHARLVDCVLPSGKSVEEVEEKTEETAESAGKLDELETQNKSSLVSAINELKALVDTLSQTVETLSEKVEGVTIDLTDFTLSGTEVDVTSAIPAGYVPKANDVIISNYAGSNDRYIFSGAVLYNSGNIYASFGYSIDTNLISAILLHYYSDLSKWMASASEV